MIGDFLCLVAIPSAFDDFTAEAFDFVRSNIAKVLVERVAGFELFAINQERARPTERVAVLIEIAKQREPAVFKRGRTVVVLAVEAGNIVVDEFRRGRVVANEDEARGYTKDL